MTRPKKIQIRIEKKAVSCQKNAAKTICGMTTTMSWPTSSPDANPIEK